MADTSAREQKKGFQTLFQRKKRKRKSKELRKREKRKVWNQPFFFEKSRDQLKGEKEATSAFGSPGQQL